MDFNIDQYVPSFLVPNTPDPAALAAGVPSTLAREYAPTARSNTKLWLIGGAALVVGFLLWRSK